jgi:hypothetical protein
MSKLFLAIVENTEDPEKMGRLQCRVLGKHTDNISVSSDTSYLPVEDLPWFESLQSVGSSTISGVSNFSVPVTGSIVVVSYFDPLEQYGVVLGCIGRKASDPVDTSIGFCDPTGTYPKTEYKDESPISRLARNEKISDTIIQTKKDEVKADVSCNGVTFSEPETKYDATYGKNSVIETQSGHILELDDTEGKERIHVYHKDGSFIEFHPGGDTVMRSKQKMFTIVLSDYNMSIDGKANIHIGSDANVEISGKINLKTSGELKINSSATVTIESSGAVNIKSSAATNIEAGGKVTVKGTIIDLDGGSGISSGSKIVLSTSPCPVFGLGHMAATCQTVNVSL